MILTNKKMPWGISKNIRIFCASYSLPIAHMMKVSPKTSKGIFLFVIFPDTVIKLDDINWIYYCSSLKYSKHVNCVKLINWIYYCSLLKYS